MNKEQILTFTLNDLTKLECKSNKNTLIISFQLSVQNLGKKEIGEKILNFLYKMKKKKIDFKINKPLPQCLFESDYNNIKKYFKIPKDCFECGELFAVEKNGMIRACNTLGNRLGPKSEYMNNKNKIYEYFKTFHQELNPSNKCKVCIWFIRKKCNCLCFKS